MKFTCLQENLTDALTKVYRAVPTKSELPILANILISADDNRLKMSATNLSTTIVTHIGASIEVNGAITVPAKMLRDFVSTLSASTLEANLKDDVLHIKSDTTKSRFNGVSASDYPDLPEEGVDLESIEIDSRKFFEAVSTVAFCASMDESRPIFTGIYVKIGDNKITMAASDGFRLSEVSFETECGEDFSVIIPAKTLVDVARVLSAEEEKIKFTIDKNDNLAIFTQGDTMIATRVIDGDYPDYTKIIPTEATIFAEFDKDEFAEAVKLTDIFAKESDSALILKVSPKGHIEVTATAKETGEHKSKIKAEVTGEQEVEIGFNSKFLLDFLNNSKNDRVTIKTAGNKSACMFLPSSEKSYLHIIMPLQIQS